MRLALFFFLTGWLNLPLTVQDPGPYRHNESMKLIQSSGSRHTPALSLGWSMEDSRVIRGGVIPADLVKGKRIVDAFGGNEVYPGKFTNPEKASLERHEVESVKKLLSKGFEVEWIIEVYENGVKTPDALINGERWEFRTVFGNGSNTVRNSIKGAKKKSNYIVVDIFPLVSLLTCSKKKSRELSVLKLRSSYFQAMPSLSESCKNNRISVEGTGQYSRCSRLALFPFP